MGLAINSRRTSSKPEAWSDRAGNTSQLKPHINDFSRIKKVGKREPAISVGMLAVCIILQPITSGQ